jgi:3-phosphoshikimate 1-carboxyvinyltransferase
VSSRVARFDPSGPLRGTLRPPPDKSISHRAALIAAMREGETTIGGYLDAADTRSTLAAIAGLGAEVEVVDPPPVEKARHRHGFSTGAKGLDLRVHGVGLRGALPSPIDVGNAGTLLRILPGWLAAQGKGAWTLDGDESIRRRTVDRIAEPLTRMGARVSCREGRFAPLRVTGAELHGIDYELPVASAQVKSCLILAALLADGPTRLVERQPTRDHTERMLRAAGAPVQTEDVGTPVAIRGQLPARRVMVEPAERIEPGKILVPGDFSSAAFIIVAALLVRGSDVRLEGVGINPGRIGLLGVLTRMGASLEVVETPAAGPEPVATITARHSRLEGTRVGGGEVPLAIDELPLCGLAACFAEGETVVSGAAELRHKESDRIGAVVAGLKKLGADVEPRRDGFAVRGTGGVRGGALEPFADHRLAMLGAVAGLASREGVAVSGMEAAEVSYPGFVDDLGLLVGG